MNGSYQVAVHFNSPDARDWSMAVANVSNLFGNESVPTGGGDLSFVVNGHGVRFLLENGREAERIRRMGGAGIRVVACGNSIGRFNIEEDELVEGIEVVPSGIAELVRLQAAGNAYLKVP